MSISCVIIDDEPLAVQLLADYASKIPELNLQFAGTDVFGAMKILNTESIDLVFLDIQMPEITGIELMELADKKHNFVITSAYRDYVLESYRFHVVDYILKPVTFDRFRQSVEKFIIWRNTFHTKETNDFLLLKADRKIHKIATVSIWYIEGLKDYIRIHTDDEKIIVLENMKDIIEQLPQGDFMRVHRSYIVATAKVKVIDGNRILLQNNVYIPIGETYRKEVYRLYQNL
jgi:two-component system LytT family response regulator